MEFDCAEALDLVESGCSMHHPCAQIVMQITVIGFRWELKLRHIYRDQNRVADMLARSVVWLHTDIRAFPCIPAGCKADMECS